MLEIYFFNVGHGDSIAIKFPNNTWGLIDCCYNGYFGEPNVLTFLKQLKVQQLEFVCVTHPHEDHYIGMDIIIEHYKNNIKQFLIYGLTKNDKEIKSDNSLGKSIKLFSEYHNFKKITRNERLEKLKSIKRNNSFNIDNVKITCLNPTEEILEDFHIKEILASSLQYNETSVVLLMEYLDVKILFNADSTTSNWKEILKNNEDYKAEISKISHHGSIENNNENILNATNKHKSIAVISSDGNIKYKTLPSEKVIDYLKNNLNSDVLATYNLNIKQEQIPTLKIKDAAEKAACALVCEDTNVKVNLYDGLIKLIVNNKGRIKKEIYDTLEKYFESFNCKK